MSDRVKCCSWDAKVVSIQQNEREGIEIKTTKIIKTACLDSNKPRFFAIHQATFTLEAHRSKNA